MYNLQRNGYFIKVYVSFTVQSVTLMGKCECYRKKLKYTEQSIIYTTIFLKEFIGHRYDF